MRFSEREIDIMKSEYHQIGCPRMAKKLGRTEKSIYACAHRLDLKGKRHHAVIRSGKPLSRIASMLEDYKMNPDKGSKELAETHGLKIHSVNTYKNYLFKYTGNNPDVIVLKSKV